MSLVGFTLADDARWCSECGEQGVPVGSDVCTLCGEKQVEPFREGWDESD